MTTPEPAPTEGERFLNALRNVIKGCYLLVLLVFLFVVMGGVNWILGDAAIIYRYRVENGSGEPVVCAVIGWFPRQSEKAHHWEPAPNVKGPAHGISLNPGESREIALTTSDFCEVKVLVRGQLATETRQVRATGLTIRIPSLSECPIASEALLPCFDGRTVVLPTD